MAPEVVHRKLAYLRSLLQQLRQHADASVDDLRKDPYRAERLLELLVTAAADLLTHLLAERDEHAGTYRETFEHAGTAGLIDPDLSARLQKAAGMRNVLVHQYEVINYEMIRQGIANILRDLPALVAQLEPLADDRG